MFRILFIAVLASCATGEANSVSSSYISSTDATCKGIWGCVVGSLYTQEACGGPDRCGDNEAFCAEKTDSMNAQCELCYFAHPDDALFACPSWCLPNIDGYCVAGLGNP